MVFRGATRCCRNSVCRGISAWRYFLSRMRRTKNKKSDFLMGGLDYAVARKLAVAGRLGAEWRKRKAAEDTSGPYAEFSGKYDYAKRSFFTGGYVYTLEETSDPERFTDTRVHRFFFNVQHSFTALIVASGSIAYEPSQLQGRRGDPDADETTSRLGAAITWLPMPELDVFLGLRSRSHRSDDPQRGQKRDRFG